jgi:hypothetical protein
VKDTTDQAETQADPTDQFTIEVATDDALDKYGYYQVHRPVLWECGSAAALLYGVLQSQVRFYAQYGKACQPSVPYLAHCLMMTDRTVRTLLDTLVKHGWLKLIRRQGLPNLYKPLRKRSEVVQPPAWNPGKYVRGTPENISAPTPENISANIENPDIEKEIEKGIAVTDLRAPAQGMRKVPPSPTPVVNLPEERAPESKGTAETKPVSTSPGTSSEERNFYWTGKPHGPTRLAQFEAFWGVYPNQEDRVGAMEHWRKSIAAQLDGATRETPLFIELFMGLQWWKDRKWSSRNPAEPAKWWLRNQRWRDMPASARSVYVAEGEK